MLTILVNLGIALLAENDNDLITKIHDIMNNSFPLVSIKQIDLAISNKDGSFIYAFCNVIIQSATKEREQYLVNG